MDSGTPGIPGTLGLEADQLVLLGQYQRSQMADLLSATAEQLTATER